jgi:hypothetical protein
MMELAVVKAERQPKPNQSSPNNLILIYAKSFNPKTEDESRRSAGAAAR